MHFKLENLLLHQFRLTSKIPSCLEFKSRSRAELERKIAWANMRESHRNSLHFCTRRFSPLLLLLRFFAWVIHMLAGSFLFSPFCLSFHYHSLCTALFGMMLMASSLQCMFIFRLLCRLCTMQTIHIIIIYKAIRFFSLLLFARVK